MLQTFWWPWKTGNSKWDGKTIDQEEVERANSKKHKQGKQNHAVINQENWNKPMDVESNRGEYPSPENQTPDRSRASMPDARGAAPYDLPASGSRRTENEGSQGHRGAASYDLPASGSRRTENGGSQGHRGAASYDLPASGSRRTENEGSQGHRGASSYDVPVSGGRRTENEGSQSHRELESSRMTHPDEETLPPLPQSTASSAPRMIPQSGSVRTSSLNAFKRLKSMGSIIEHPEKLPTLPPPGDLGAYGYPTTKVDHKKERARQPGYQAYKATKCACCFDTCLLCFLLACVLTTFIFAIVYGHKDCHYITILVILLDVILCAILFMEYVQRWVWREPIPPANNKKRVRMVAEPTVLSGNRGRLPVIGTNPGRLTNPGYPIHPGDSDRSGGLFSYSTPQRLYDTPKILTAIFLIFLYTLGTILILAVMGTAANKMDKCEILSVGSIIYAVVLLILLSIRVAMCCVSDACRGICHLMKSKVRDPVPMVADNQLHQYLPGMSGSWHTGGETGTARSRQPTAWLMNLTGTSDPRQQLSIIQPMPAEYSHDLDH